VGSSRPAPILRLIQNGDEAVQYFVELRGGHVPGAVEDDAFVCCEETVRANAAALIESARCEIGAVENYGI
jgi:hypothetical protein